MSNSSYNITSVHDHIIRLRQRYLNNTSGKLLDHGFGNGVCSLYFQQEGFCVYGADLDTPVVRAFRDSPGIDKNNFKMVGENQSKLPFSDNYFSVVISNQVLNFINSRQQIDSIIGEFFRVLNPDGRTIVTIMAEDNYFFTEHALQPVPDKGEVRVRLQGWLERDAVYYRFLNIEDVRLSFEQCGFVIDDIGYFDYSFLDVKRAKHYIVLARKPGKDGLS